MATKGSQMLIVEASPHISTWFEHPESIDHYGKYAIVERTVFSFSRSLDLRSASDLPKGSAEFIERSLSVFGATTGKPDAYLGDFAQSGSSFESIERSISSKRIRNDWTIRLGTDTSSFFNERLSPLLALANSFLYCDKYAAEQMCSGKFGSFLGLVSGANRSLDLRIVTGAPSQPHSENWNNACKSSVKVLKDARFKGKFQMLKRDWDHNRFMRLGFPGGLFLIWEPSFSADRWDAKLFQLQHEVSFSRFSEYDEKDLVNRLLVHREGVPSMMPFIKSFE